MATPEDPADDESIAPFPGDAIGRSRSANTAIIAAVVIAGLYFGRDVLVPVAFAILLSFALTPLVVALQRLHLGRIAPVFLSVFMAFAILAGLGGVIGRQVAELASDLPQYQRVISHKIDALRASDFANGMIDKATGLLHGLNFNPPRPAPQPAPTVGAEEQPPGEPAPLPVEVRQPSAAPLQILENILSALLPPLTTAAIVVVFVIFILLQQRDLRDQFIGLIGAQDLHRTTKALDDAAERLSRYFSILTAINAAFGVVVAVGLAIIGVPNPILWGVLAGVLRFLPYIGAIISAAFPMAIAAAVAPGWGLVFETGALFLVIETITGQLIEPHLFGHTTGMSPLAIILAVAFWTMIWGPSGLLLSTPLTACLVAIGRHVDGLNFIALMLSDRPVLSPDQSLYQRILASDPDEAAFQAERLLKTMSLLDYYENVALPALELAQADVARGVLEPGRQAAIYASVSQIVADLGDHTEPPEPHEKEAAAAPAPEGKVEEPPAPRRLALCLAGRSLLDQAACAILVQLLERQNAPARMTRPMGRADDAVGLNVDELCAICILYLDAQRLAALRFSVRRLRKRFPGTPIAVCVWGANDLSELGQIANADATVATLREAVDFCIAAAKPAPAGETAPKVEARPTPSPA